MKRLLILTVLLFAFPCMAQLPAYTNGQYYAWTNAALATNAMNYINTAGWFPIFGHNANTGAVESNKTATTKWADTIIVTTNALYCFDRIPDTLLDYIGVPASNRVAFALIFQPMVKPKEAIVMPVPGE